MQLWVGLGNPGAEYAATRHNVGFMAVDAIAKRYDAGSFRQKFQAEIADCRIEGERILLLKPLTFMNLSGQAVGEAARFYKLSPLEITVFHDELDLAPFKVKIKTGGGVAGHNGLKSIDQHLGEAGFRRVRIGIGHPGDRARVTGHVLSPFARDEIDDLGALLAAFADTAPLLAAGRASDAMSRIAMALQSAKPDAAALGERAPDNTAPHASSPDDSAPDNPAPGVESAPEAGPAAKLKKIPWARVFSRKKDES